MEYSKLEKNMIEVLKEEQAKLGYRSEKMRLYYPLQSLNRFLGTNFSPEEMQAELRGFSLWAKERLGDIEVSRNKESFCFLLPPQASDFVHGHMGDAEFICDLVRTVSRHGATLEEVLGQFYRHSDHVHVEKAAHGEFDYLVYFEDGKPDAFRYCITEEGGHITYHRFTEEDYLDFAFASRQ